MLTEEEIRELIPKRIGMYGPASLATREQWISQVRSATGTARAIFEGEGRVGMQFLVLCARDPLTGEREPCLYLLQAPDREYTPVLKRAVSEVLRYTCKKGAARATLMISEVWALRTQEPGVAEAHIASGKSLSEHPDRQEVLFVHAEDAVHGTVIASAPITEANGRRELGDFEVRTDCTHTEGRFAQLLVPPGAVPGGDA